MNITGWFFTLLMIFSSLKDFHSFTTTCDCSIKAMKAFDASIHVCKQGRRMHKTSAEDLGDCRDSLWDYLRDLFYCASNGPCASFVLIFGKLLLIFCLPYLTDTPTRLLVHAVANSVKLTSTNVEMNGIFNLIICALLFLGYFVFHWNLRNGDGFMGPVVRARSRDGSGRFK